MGCHVRSRGAALLSGFSSAGVPVLGASNSCDTRKACKSESGCCSVELGCGKVIGSCRGKPVFSKKVLSDSRSRCTGSLEDFGGSGGVLIDSSDLRAIAAHLCESPKHAFSSWSRSSFSRVLDDKTITEQVSLAQDDLR